MKKLLSFTLAFVLMFTMLPFNVLATENDHLTPEEHLALACEIFPEYADHILSARFNSQSSRSTNREIIICESKDIEGNNKMTYVEYSDGEVLVASSFAQGSVSIDSVSGSGVALYVVDLLVTVFGSSQQFIVDNVRFTINYNENDFITSAGNWSASTTRQNDGSIIQSQQTSSTSLARIQYSAEFKMNDNSLPLTPGIDFYVGNNTYNLRVV